MIERRKNHGERWDDEADQRLRFVAGQGLLLPAMAKALGRSLEAVRTRANIIGVPFRSSLRGRAAQAPATDGLIAPSPPSDNYIVQPDFQPPVIE